MHDREKQDMSARTETRSVRAAKLIGTTADGGTTLAKSRAKSAGETARAARADDKRAFLNRLERSRMSLFHGSD